MINAKRIVYVLESTRHPTRHYVGLTSNLVARLEAHNSGHCPHTARDRPWRILVHLEFAAEHSAALFERYLKSGSGRVFAKRHFV